MNISCMNAFHLIIQVDTSHFVLFSLRYQEGQNNICVSLNERHLLNPLAAALFCH